MISRPRLGALAASALLFAGLLAGCSSSDDESAGGTVQLNLPDGRSVTIPDTPERIVTLGDQWTDVVLSFGETPVGYYDYSKSATGEMQPWYGEKLADATFVDPTKGDDATTIAKLNPDLIFAPGFASDSPEFQQISKLAPTVNAISDQEIDPWQDMVTVMGTVLHDPEKAKSIIDDTNAKIAAVAQEYPDLKGKTYAFAFMYGNDQLSVLGDENDGAGKLFTSLGMKMAPKLVAEYQRTGQPRFGLSTENIPMLDADVLVVATATPEQAETLKSLPGYKNLKAVKDNAVTFMTQSQITGLNAPTPNSIPYVLDLLKPSFAAASN
ncbi:ABC transporter substrate-binding protein [Gordonia hongkongensis]|uniref:ABC transporter substrate-binding protein n=1 Tax=Gordonia hongkongensis TaxID=1701090 RepID=A0AAX3T8L9_9ACTN|nr:MULTISPECIES: ABC transporter substrate-binding protein [Gordonia]MCZ4534140.1 ABC transporter substrate-binding protein [Gordonia terrae]OCW86241.1 ABC transporter substrate-binding protein [Nocardia farcinica]MBN0973865.1 ABC transporter substrate-binding protein [Gordonia sp. BP-119]MBN0983708.1 ABC transporter substrate-binding protein [Gordonia sp. BP-94]MBR7191969.1 ABC transporter substrate-binding protein [Gordonia sp. SCSIO 19800]